MPGAISDLSSQGLTAIRELFNKELDDHMTQGNKTVSHGSKSPRKKAVVNLIVTCCLAIFLLGAGIALFSISKSKLDNLSSTDGTIIDTKTCSAGGNSGGTTEAAVIEYFDPVNNATYQFTTSICSNPGPTVGKTIKVLYDPEVPGEAYDGSFIGLWLLPLIIIGIGVCFLIGCCSSLFCVRKAFAPSPTITKIEQPSLVLTPSYPTAAAPSAPPDPYKTSTEPEIKVNPYSTIASGNQYSTIASGNQYSTIASSNQYSTTASSNQYSTPNSGQTSSNTNAGTSIFDQLR